MFVNVVRYFQSQSDYELVVGLPENHRPVIQDQLDVLSEGPRSVEFREFVWNAHPPEHAEFLLRQHGIPVEQMVSAEYCTFAGSEQNFLDCDFWLFVSDRITLTLLPFKPFGVLVTDHLQRYVPEIFEKGAYADRNSIVTNFLRNVRNADLAIATSGATFGDLQSYSGARGRILRIPTAVDVDYFETLNTARSPMCNPVADSPYFVWVTNSSQHKNHLKAIDALKAFFGDSDSELDVIITGANTDLFDPDFDVRAVGNRQLLYDLPYIKQVRTAFATELSEWKHRIRFAGEVPDTSYSAILRDAAFLWHNVIADNGTFSVIEAAIMGTPSISSSYPQMHELDEEFGLGMSFFDPFCVESAVDAMSNYRELPAPEPVNLRSQLHRHHFSAWGSSLCDVVTDCIDSPRLAIECL